MAITQSTVTQRNGLPLIEITVPFGIPSEPDSGETFQPRVSHLVSSTASTGGTLLGMKIYNYFLVALKASKRSKSSRAIEIQIPAGTNTNTVTISGDKPFDDAADQYEVYRSPDDIWNPRRIIGPTSIPDPFEFTDTGLAGGLVLPPDDEYAGARLYWRRQGESFWQFATETKDRTQTSVKFQVPFNIQGQIIDVQLRAVARSGGETPETVAATTTFTVTGVRGSELSMELGSDVFGQRIDAGRYYDNYDFVAGTFRERWDIANLRRGILRTPTIHPLEAEGGVHSFGSAAELSTNSRAGVDAGQQYTLYADNGFGRLWRNTDRALFNDSQWGMFGTPGQALHVFGGVSRIEAAGQVRLDFNNTLIGQAAGFEHNNDTNTLDMARLGVARVLTMPSNNSRIGVARTPANTFEAEGVMYSRGSAASLVVERRDSLGNNAQLYSDGGAVRLFDSVGSADRVQWARDTGKMAIGATPGTAFLKIEDDDWIDANKRVADPRRLLASHVSYRPLSNPLTATDAGATATVSVAAFTNRFAGVDVSYNSGSIASLSFDTLYFIYTDDAGFAGGAVTYNATTVKETALNGSGRIFVGSIRTPKDGAPDTVGNNDGGVAAQFGGEAEHTAVAVTTSGTTSNPNNAIDGDWGTFGQAGGSTTGNLTLTTWGGDAFFGRRTALKLTAKYQLIAPDSGPADLAELRYSKDSGATWTSLDLHNPANPGVETATFNIDLNTPIGAFHLQARYIDNTGNNNSVVRIYEAVLRETA